MLELTNTKLTGIMAERLVWGCTLIGQVLLAALCLYFVGPVTRPSSSALVVLATIGFILLATAYYLRSEIQTDREPDPRVPPRVNAKSLPTRFVAGLACAEAVGLVGLAARILGHSLPTALVFFAASTLALLLQYPRSRDFATESAGHVA